MTTTQAGPYRLLRRMSTPGHECVHCGTVMGADLRCAGCGWVDPMTRRPDGVPTTKDRYAAPARAEQGDL